MDQDHEDRPEEADVLKLPQINRKRAANPQKSFSAKFRVAFRTPIPPPPPEVTSLPDLLYRSTLKKSNFRLLQLQSGSTKGPVACELQEHSIHDAPEYVALSYVWGEEPELHDIKLNGLRGRIRPNLFYALQRKRHQEKSLLIWVDSLCINQYDNSERTQQVRLMSDIYRNATKVWIWLGEADATSRDAMGLCERLARPDFPWADKWWKDSQFVAICRIMDRPWFRRGWVIQEAAFAKVAAFFCGDRQLDLVTFRDGVKKIHFKIREKMATLKHIDSTSFQRFVATFCESPATKFFEILDQAFDKTARQSEWRCNLSLETLVGASTYTNTTDHRDTVYSLLNLAKDVDLAKDADLGKDADLCLVPQMRVQQSIVPDYEKKTLEVYADFILHCSRSGSIDIICRPWAPPPPFGHPRPTWLRYRDFSPFGDPSQPSDLQRHARPLVGTASQRRLYNCDNNSIPQLSASFSPDGGTFDESLSIRGVILGEIMRASTRMASAIIIKECLEILGLSLSNLGPTLDLMPPAIWRTLCADRDKEGNPAPQSYASAFAQLLKGSSQSGAESEPVEVWEGFASIDIEDRISLDAPNDDIEYFEVLRDTVWNRRTCRLKSFLSTTESLVGLIPQQARAGDQVCFLYGCSVPVVLREVSQEAGKRSWHILGDAYIHGMMNGEALDGKLEEEDFRIC